VFDISVEPPSLVGIVPSGTKVAYTTDPGVRRFMVLAALCGRPREWQALFGLAEHIKARQSGPGTAADLAFGIAIALSRIDLRGPDPLLSVT